MFQELTNRLCGVHARLVFKLTLSCMISFRCLKDHKYLQDLSGDLSGEPEISPGMMDIYVQIFITCQN